MIEGVSYLELQMSQRLCRRCFGAGENSLSPFQRHSLCWGRRWPPLTSADSHPWGALKAAAFSDVMRLDVHTSTKRNIPAAM